MAETPVFVFRDIAIIADPRVNREMQRCLRCSTPLREMFSADGNYMLRYGQCPKCQRVYVLDDLHI